MYICFMYWCMFCKKYSHHGISPLKVVHQHVSLHISSKRARWLDLHPSACWLCNTSASHCLYNPIANHGYSYYANTASQFGLCWDFSGEKFSQACSQYLLWWLLHNTFEYIMFMHKIMSMVMALMYCVQHISITWGSNVFQRGPGPRQ